MKTNLLPIYLIEDYFTINTLNDIDWPEFPELPGGEPIVIGDHHVDSTLVMNSVGNIKDGTTHYSEVFEQISYSFAMEFSNLLIEEGIGEFPLSVNDFSFQWSEDGTEIFDLETNAYIEMSVVSNSEYLTGSDEYLFEVTEANMTSNQIESFDVIHFLMIVLITLVIFGVLLVVIRGIFSRKG